MHLRSLVVPFLQLYNYLVQLGVTDADTSESRTIKGLSVSCWLVTTLGNASFLVAWTILPVLFPEYSTGYKVLYVGISALLCIEIIGGVAYWVWKTPSPIQWVIAVQGTVLIPALLFVSSGCESLASHYMWGVLVMVFWMATRKGSQAAVVWWFLTECSLHLVFNSLSLTVFSEHCIPKPILYDSVLMKILMGPFQQYLRDALLLAITYWFLNQERKHRQEIAETVHSVSMLAGQIANYDLGDIDVKELRSHKTEMFNHLATIIENLRKYKPFLPDTLFHGTYGSESESSDDESIPSDTKSPMVPRVYLGKGPHETESAVHERPMTSRSDTGGKVLLQCPLTIRTRVTALVFRIGGLDEAMSTLKMSSFRNASESGPMANVHQLIVAFTVALFDTVHSNQGTVFSFGTSHAVALWNHHKYNGEYASLAVGTAVDVHSKWVALLQSDSQLTNFSKMWNLNLSAGIAMGRGVCGVNGSSQHQTLHILSTVIKEATLLSELATTCIQSPLRPILVPDDIFEDCQYHYLCCPVDSVNFPTKSHGRHRPRNNSNISSRSSLVTTPAPGPSKVVTFPISTSNPKGMFSQRATSGSGAKDSKGISVTSINTGNGMEDLISLHHSSDTNTTISISESEVTTDPDNTAVYSVLREQRGNSTHNDEWMYEIAEANSDNLGQRVASMQDAFRHVRQCEFTDALKLVESLLQDNPDDSILQHWRALALNARPITHSNALLATLGHYPGTGGADAVTTFAASGGSSPATSRGTTPKNADITMKMKSFSVGRDVDALTKCTTREYSGWALFPWEKRPYEPFAQSM